MAEWGGAELVVVQGFVRGEVDGRALRVPDPEDPEATVVGPVTSEPVALLEQAAAPMLLDLGAHTHLKTQPRSTLPVEATGYWAMLVVATNDPNVTPYGGRRFTLPDGTARTVQVPHNAPETAVTAEMAAQVNAGLTAPILTVGEQVRAVWLTDAAEFEVPPDGPFAYYTATEVDALLAGVATPSFPDIGGQLADDQVPTTIARSTSLATKLDRAVVDAKGDLLVGTDSDTVDRLPVGSDGRVLTADSTTARGVSWLAPTGGGGGGSGSATLPELARTARTSALDPAADLLDKTTRFDTTGGGVTQPLPSAVPGRRFAVAWSAADGAQANRVTLAAASRTDSVTVTSGSATVQDASITADDAGRTVTGTGVPSGSFVGTVTPGVSFLLSSSASTQANVTATSSGSQVVISDGLGESGAATAVVGLVGDVDVWHCTHTGRWRAAVGRKTQAALDARFVPSSLRGPLGGVVDLGAVASGATVSPDATVASQFTATAAAGGFTLTAPTGGTPGQTVGVFVTAQGGARTVVFGTGLAPFEGDSTSLTIPAGKLGCVLLRVKTATTATVLSARREA